MGILSENFGTTPITKENLYELGFRPHKPVSHIFGDPYSFIKTMAVTDNDPSWLTRRMIGKFSLTVTFPRGGGDPVALLAKHQVLESGLFAADNKNAIVVLDVDLETLKSMMTDSYLRSLI